MRLRNRQTGEIYDFKITPDYDDVMSGWKIENKDFGVRYYSHLAELAEEWEDVPEEPKTFFTIYYDGTISEFKDGDDDQIRDMKSIGNYFETKEEAEKALEKLKAWKRLKDAGFKFKDFGRLNDCAFFIRATSNESWSELYDDLDLLFGGGE